MGIIYRLISPKGKSYIGQTIHTLQMRFNQHVNKAFSDSSKCWAICSTIIKYGEENITKEIIFECDNDELNFYEEIFIDLFGTLYPSGYNLTSGGSAPVTVCQYSREKISKSKRKYWIDRDLPIGVYRFVDDGSEGYKIYRKGYKSRQCCLPTLTMPQKLEKVMKYLRDIDNGIIVHKSNKILPTYITLVNIDGRTGYEVNKHPFQIRRFLDQNLEINLRLDKAVEYLEEIEAGFAPLKRDRRNNYYDGVDMNYIQECKTKKGNIGFIICFPQPINGKKSKKFTSDLISQQQRLINAINFRDNNINYAVQRLNGRRPIDTNQKAQDIV